MQKNTVEAGGSVEESAEGLRSIAVIFPMMTFLMLAILMVQSQNFQKMLLEISVAPIDKGGRFAWSELPRDPNRQFFRGGKRLADVVQPAESAREHGAPKPLW